MPFAEPLQSASHRTTVDRTPDVVTPFRPACFLRIEWQHRRKPGAVPNPSMFNSIAMPPSDRSATLSTREYTRRRRHRDQQRSHRDKCDRIAGGNPKQQASQRARQDSRRRHSQREPESGQSQRPEHDAALQVRRRTLPAPFEFQFPAPADLPKTKSRRRSPARRGSRRKPRIRPATAPETAAVKPLCRPDPGTSQTRGPADSGRSAAEPFESPPPDCPVEARFAPPVAWPRSPRFAASADTFPTRPPFPELRDGRRRLRRRPSVPHPS